MKNNEFNKAIDSIEEPAKLKEKTFEAVKNSEKKYKPTFNKKGTTNKKHRLTYKPWMKYVASVLVICLAITGGLFAWDRATSNYNKIAIGKARDLEKVSYTQHYQNLQNNNIVLTDELRDKMNQSLFEMSKLAVNDNENTVFSPLNLYMVLGIIQEMAGGESKQQILDYIGMTEEEVRQTYELIYQVFCQNTDDAKLIINSSAWFNNMIDYNQETVDAMAKYYYADIFNCDFTDKNTSKKIKKWLSDNSDKAFGSNDDVGEMQDVMIKLFTVFDYYSKWFEELDETTINFKSYGQSQKNVEAINYYNKEAVFYIQENCTSAYLNMKDDYGMVVVLPNGDNKVSDIINNTALLNNALTFTNKPYAVSGILDCTMPTFDFTSEYNLVEMVKELGITDAFEIDKANFSNISEQGLYISEMAMKAYVKVDKKGTKAGAMTRVNFMVTSSAPIMNPEKLVLRLDRPFIYAIMRDNVPIFIGAVVNP